MTPRQAELAHAVRVLRGQHAEQHAALAATGDEEAHDAWLMALGTCALRLAEERSARHLCDEGTADRDCVCNSCEHRFTTLTPDGYLRVSAAEALRMGAKLHGQWLDRRDGITRPAAPRPAAPKTLPPLRKSGPIDYRGSWRRNWTHGLQIREGDPLWDALQDDDRRTDDE